VTGVEMIPFAKPGASVPHHEMGAQAARAALDDAGLAWEDVEQACAGYAYGASTCGQKALYGVGMTGIPVVNVNNNCATGSTALFLARQAAQDVLDAPAIWPGLRAGVHIAAQALTTDRPGTFDSNDMMRLVGYDMGRGAAQKVYAQAGVGPDGLDVVELHDCFAHNTYGARSSRIRPAACCRRATRSARRASRDASNRRTSCAAAWARARWMGGARRCSTTRAWAAPASSRCIRCEEAPRHPHNAARGTCVDVDGVTQPALAPRFSRTPGQAGTVAAPGRDAAAILADRGWTEDAIATLRRDNIVQAGLRWRHGHFAPQGTRT
jgi:hypothetical protein